MKSQSVMLDIAALLRARNPLLWVVTGEEARVEDYLYEAAALAGFLTQFWDVAAGFTDYSGKPLNPYGAIENAAQDPDEALKRIDTTAGQRTVWVLRDFPAWISGPTGPIALRALKNLARSLPGRDQDDAQAIIVISPTKDVPAELANHATVLEWPLPDREEIGELLDATVEPYIEDLPDIMNGTRDAAIDAAVGLSGEEAQATFAKSIVQLKQIDPGIISAEKKRKIAKDGLLEWIEPLPRGLKSVGGLENLTSWAASLATAFSPEARAYGLPSPKGAVLVGIPGCGKSYMFKALAGEWQVPLIKLDLGALKSKYVGESEGNLRKALGVIEAVGRCIVAVDEIEKALAGASGEAGDGGVSADALGALLSWMQDRQGEAFVIATANNAEKLPPELLRKGRFDEVWWVDLPTTVERAAVLSSAMRTYDTGPNGGIAPVDLNRVAEATDTFTGAEMAALVPDALRTAFNDGVRKITTDDLLMAAKDVVPLAKQQSEKIARLREFWLGRARPASKPEAGTVRKGKGRLLDIN
jgi:hypothetical protein